MLACTYLFDLQNANTATFGSSNAFVSWLNQIDELATRYMFPITRVYTVCSIVDRPGLLTGIIAGALAANGGSSFPDAMIDGFATGYIILGLEKLTAEISRSLEGIKALPLSSILGLALTNPAMLAINSAVVPASDALTSFLSGLSGTNATLLGAAIGGMLAPDSGGPINKTVYLLSVATLIAADEGTIPSIVMTSCGRSAMVTAISYAVTRTLFSKEFNESLRGVKVVVYIMELSFFVEGAIPFVADRPKKILPSLCAEAAVTGALVAMFGITLSIPVDGPETLLLANNVPLYLLSSAARTTVAVCVAYFFTRDEPDQE